MTTINESVALRRFHQGLYYLLGTTNQGRQKVDQESFLAVVAIMAYLGAYAFPDDNLYNLRERLIDALNPLEDSADIKTVVEQATEVAQLFRRPWSEPGSQDGPTI